ncbi:MAG TPA: DUF192 domain-containing protein, partial [Acidimicrobiia bacterium]|nr:DUF192 domain-containing protein [Acidimicrobiia bacterium]
CGDRASITQAQFVEVSGTQISVLVADSPEERQQGLKEAEVIPGGADGMLFVHDTPSRVNYVMLDVPIALDIWFFAPDGVLIGSTEMSPCPAEPCPLYSSPGAVSWVLETVAGTFRFEEGAVLTGAPNGETG